MTEELKIVKRGACSSLSGKSTLKYEFARTEDGKELFVRVSGNTGGGYWNSAFIPVAEIEKAFLKSPDHITSVVLNPITRGRSVNTAGFVLSIFLAEGLVQPIKGKTRIHQLAEDYKERLAQLTSSEPQARPKTARKKATATKERAPARAKAR
jgi:hypothetical protein